MIELLSLNKGGIKGKPSTIAYRVGLLKVIFEWGHGKNLFPKNLSEFPTDVVNEINKKRLDHIENTDGFAFIDLGDEKLFVEAILGYEPEDDEDFLCHCFWKIAICTSARNSYIRNLEAFSCLNPMANSPQLYGITAPYADKAGNVNGEVPILDEIGVNAIRDLQDRARAKGWQPIQNPVNKQTYVHLFQIDRYPGILSYSSVQTFLKNKILPRVPELQKYDNFGAHKFRHHIVTEVAKKTKNIQSIMLAGNWRSFNMPGKVYLNSAIARNSLAYALHAKFEDKEITGKFYLKIIELLSMNGTPKNELMQALTTEMTMDEFIAKYGRRTKNQMGYCFNKSCEIMYKCWGCSFFLMKREEIESTIRYLAAEILDYSDFVNFSGNKHTEANSLASSRITAITLITKRLIDLGLTEQQIHQMVIMCWEGGDVSEVLREPITV